MFTHIGSISYGMLWLDGIAVVIIAGIVTRINFAAIKKIRSLKDL